MLALLSSYYCIPRRLRPIVRWLAMCLFMVVLVIVISFTGVLIAVRNAQGQSLLHPQPHQPLSPDSISDHSNRQYRPKENL